MMYAFRHDAAANYHVTVQVGAVYAFSTEVSVAATSHVLVQAEGMYAFSRQADVAAT